MTDNADLRTLMAENAALRHRLPDELRDILMGDTREEIDAHAVALSRFVPAEPLDDPELAGGLDPYDTNGGESQFDAAATAARLRSRRY